MTSPSVKAFLSQAVVGRRTEACSQCLKSVFEQSSLFVALDSKALLEMPKGSLFRVAENTF